KSRSSQATKQTSSHQLQTNFERRESDNTGSKPTSCDRLPFAPSQLRGSRHPEEEAQSACNSQPPLLPPAKSLRRCRTSARPSSSRSLTISRETSTAESRSGPSTRPDLFRSSSRNEQGKSRIPRN